MRAVTASPIVTWVIELLREYAGGDWGDGESYADLPSFPYGVIHHVGSTRWGGALEAPDANLDVVVQVDAIGRRGDQARALLDRVRGVLIDTDDDGLYRYAPHARLTDAVVRERRHLSGPTPVEPAGESPDRVYTTSERFTIRTVARSTT